MPVRMAWARSARAKRGQQVRVVTDDNIWAECITPGPNQLRYASDANRGRPDKLSLEGKALGAPRESGKQPKQSGWIHEIDCLLQNVVFIAGLLKRRLRKPILHPQLQEARSARLRPLPAAVCRQGGIDNAPIRDG